MLKQFHKFIAFILIFCCLIGTAQPAIASENNSAPTIFQAHLISEDGFEILGSFLKDKSQIFIELGTLKAMSNDINIYHNSSDGSISIYRTIHPGDTLISNPDKRTASFPKDRILTSDEGTYVPFAYTMETLRLNPIVDKKNEQLIITTAKDMDQLGLIMEEIYTDACYNMRYWKDSKNYRFDVGMAEMVSAIRDLSLISFVSGDSTKKSYQEAFAQILMPQDAKEVDFSTGYNETLGLMNTFFSLSKDVAGFSEDYLDIDLMGDLKDTYDIVFDLVGSYTTANETLKIEDQIELATYFHVARESEESIIRALDYISPKTHSVSKKMEKALKKVMKAYNKKDPLWLQVANNLGDQMLGRVENLIKEKIPHSYAFDIGNNITDFYCNTGKQLSATIQASRFLDIQTCCQMVFDDVLSNYKGTMGEAKGEWLQIMYDVTNLYLLAGLRAQEAMSQVDKDLKAATSYSIKRIKEEQDRMAQFTTTDIQSYKNYEDAENWLFSLEGTSLTSDEFFAPQQISTDNLSDMPIFITITWESEVDGRPMDMDANITGTLDDGTSVFRAPTEGEYITNSGRVASHYYYGKWIDLEIFRRDAVLDVVVEYGHVMPFDAPSYSEANVDIHIYTPEETIAIIAANPETSTFAGSPYIVDLESFLLRAGTGVWFFGFRFDHGSFQSLANEYVPETTPDEYFEQSSDTSSTDSDPIANPELDQKSLIVTDSKDRIEEFYTADGQLQYSERYNSDGYKLEYRWYDNGECTAYTHWTYNEKNHLTRIRFMNVMDPDVVQMDFKNIYSGNQLQKVELYNVAGTLLGEGATAADAADAVGMRMMVEESLPK